MNRNNLVGYNFADIINFLKKFPYDHELWQIWNSFTEKSGDSFNKFISLVGASMNTGAELELTIDKISVLIVESYSMNRNVLPINKSKSDDNTIESKIRKFFEQKHKGPKFLTAMMIHNIFKDSQRYPQFCDIVLRGDKMWLPIEEKSSFIIEEVCKMENNFVIQLINGEKFQCIEELIRLIPYFEMLLSDIGGNATILPLTFDCSADNLKLIINYITEVRINDCLSPFNVLDLLFLTEQLLVPRIIGIILDCLLEEGTIEHLTQFDNFNLERLIKLSVLLLELKRSEDPLITHKAKQVISKIFSEICTTITRNPEFFKQNIFVFRNWPQLFSEKDQEKTVLYSKNYSRANESLISPKNIVEYFIRYDLSSNCYESVFSRFNLSTSEIYFTPQSYSFQNCRLHLNSIIVITSYYPLFGYTEFVEIPYESVPSAKLDGHSVKMRLRHSHTKLSINKELIFGNNISSENADNRRFITQIYKCNEYGTRIKISEATVCSLPDIYYEIILDAPRPINFGDRLWMVEHTSHIVEL
jgi:hypothetical protein